MFYFTIIYSIPADFGLARQKNPDASKLMSMVGTIVYSWYVLVVFICCLGFMELSNFFELYQTKNTRSSFFAVFINIFSKQITRFFCGILSQPIVSAI